ncbi:mitochondrial glycine cleavage system glycine dehydrogenase (P-protein GcsP) [Andalucia godoyi]|uniref:Glycine cleavage system P protein n=1 Tax=Andalucia godoyi TaxID=505711 RepID=A0A8K0F460_ANDGO|nr:mitochondrial glycine cleavage system glycine dehydrogenase (P-protein GcsP) [Andalucia godoyi]|eukprot:ANDGO_06511.mRNA.1 mitochondrial glycine cleavage system glycine dehydrogenase (P-protein GcsP)
MLRRVISGSVRPAIQSRASLVLLGSRSYASSTVVVAAASTSPFAPLDSFTRRHIGSSDKDLGEMLNTVGATSLDGLVSATVPPAIYRSSLLNLGPEKAESTSLSELKAIASQNKVLKSFIGQGFYGTITPPVVLRNVIENPAWYTSYTPYQAEIAQGRLESLLNFQQMVQDLTGFDCANASLLDEATACAEALSFTHRVVAANIFSGEADAAEVNAGKNTFIVSADCHPQDIAVVKTRAYPLGITVKVVQTVEEIAVLLNGKDALKSVFGVMLQYPTTDGRVLSVEKLQNVAAAAKKAGAMTVAVTDLLALTMVRPPAEWGADVAIGSSQRFGVPMNYGGPLAAFFATSEKFKRQAPGRIIGVSKDSRGRPALRMALQTREQHIRREKATSNICTAQALLANVAAMYAVYHGAEGLTAIANRAHGMAETLRQGLVDLGLLNGAQLQEVFDTFVVANLTSAEAAAVHSRSVSLGFNLRNVNATSIGVSVDETTTREDLVKVLAAFVGDLPSWKTSTVEKVPAAQWEKELAARLKAPKAESVLEHLYERAQSAGRLSFSKDTKRTSAFLTHPVFQSYHTEHEMLRYLHRLQARDISLANSMIALGSCTMKLNATVELIPVTWPEFANMHPYAPVDQAAGYERLFADLRTWLSEITGFPGLSLQPISGSSGEYAGLMVIRKYLEAKGEIPKRNICLIPVSAHGTNPASAVLVGFDVMTVACDKDGNVDLADLEAKLAQHGENVACVMVTYPSTHGIYEEGIRQITAAVHKVGAQVYMDGANMNAQVGLTRPADIGADVCHLNLHKTFAIPHGGGGPPAAPIGVAAHLVPYMPGNPLDVEANSTNVLGAVSGTRVAVPAILPISWTYINLMGASGLRKATSVAILNANYMAKRLEKHYPVLYRGKNGFAAHEFILDLRPIKAVTGIEAEDIAKRLMDYGFHAPTMSFPVSGTLMIEPTESESRAELDRFCDVMIQIRAEIAEIEAGRMDRKNNPLKNAPHTAADLSDSNWNRPYSRETAAFPLPYLRNSKFWPSVNRVDNLHGDRAFTCSCWGVPLTEYNNLKKVA